MDNQDSDFVYLMTVRESRKIDIWYGCTEAVADVARAKVLGTHTSDQDVYVPDPLVVQMRARFNNMDILHIRSPEQLNPDEFEDFLCRMTRDEYEAFVKKYKWRQ